MTYRIVFWPQSAPERAAVFGPDRSDVIGAITIARAIRGLLPTDWTVQVWQDPTGACVSVWNSVEDK